jgi:hypothetical protein
LGAMACCYLATYPSISAVVTVDVDSAELRARQGGSDPAKVST